VIILTNVTINNPANQSNVKHQVLLEGTVKELPKENNTELWVVKEVNGRYHPDDGPVIITGEKWKSYAYVGNRTLGSDKGKIFTIHIVEVSPDVGGKEFKKYLDTAERDGWKGIASIYDGKIKATTRVIRNDSYILVIINSIYNEVINSPIKTLSAALAIIAAMLAIFKYIL
jgi:hypothetical protein